MSDIIRTFAARLANMELQTKIDIKPLGDINHASKVMLIGSCFTEHISAKLESLRFQTLTNPNGITYNPMSIAETLDRLVDERGYDSNNILCHDGLYYSPEHHGCFSSASAEETAAKISKSFETAYMFLKKTSHIIVTLGSAVVYEHNGRIWNNCHKLPAKEFKSRLLTVDEIVERWEHIIRKLPQVKFIFTVSPVRYLNDKQYSNSVNKATLLLASNELTRRFQNAIYFPAYEVVMDELRDYRFYADDMIHPSQMAVNIVFERFAQAFFSKETIEINNLVEKVEAMRNHRPLHPESPEYDKFKQKLYEYENNLNCVLAAHCDSNPHSPE